MERPKLDALLDMHKAFWNKKDIGKPLINTEHPSMKRIGLDFTIDRIPLADGSWPSDALGAVDITFDPPPFSARAQALLPLLKRLQMKKPLIIDGVIRPKDLNMLRTELSPEGLLIDVELEL